MAKPLCCPDCGAPAHTLLARQRLVGEQQYLVRVADDGVPYLAPVDHTITGQVGPLYLECERCNYEWPTRRAFRIVGDDDG